VTTTKQDRSKAYFDSEENQTPTLKEDK